MSWSKQTLARAVRAAAGLSLVMVAACGDRPTVWDAPVDDRSGLMLGLTSSVAVVDDPAHRVVFLEPRAGQELARTALPVGHGVVHADVSADRSKLFVLTVGDTPRKSPRDEPPSLWIYEPGPAGPVARSFPLAAPLRGMTLDPLGRYVALYAGDSARTSFVENPNEIVIVDLLAPAGQEVTPRTLRSFGAQPERITFTPELSLPGGPRRLLVVETSQYLSLLDLGHLHDVPERPDVTVRLTSGASDRVLSPAAVVFDDGDPARSDDARIGVRLANDRNVVVLTLEPPAPGGTLPANDFVPRINLVDVEGVASDIAFVRTDGGLRLAALVPDRMSAVLVDPETSVTTQVGLPERYSHLSLITGIVGGPAPGADVALLYGASGRTTGGVAFWSLGRTSGQPYRSVEVLSVQGPVGRVLSVPEPHPELRVLESEGASFYVLDLVSRTASPLHALTQASLEVSPDGRRLWAFQRGAGHLASVTLEDVHPIPLSVDRPIDAIFDVARPDGGRALVALHAREGLGATVFDALAPDLATARSYSGLLLEGL